MTRPKPPRAVTTRAKSMPPVDGRRMLTKCTVTVAARQKGARSR